MTMNLDFAPYDAKALEHMRELNRFGCMTGVQVGDTVRQAAARWARGGNHMAWADLPPSERALILHHDRALLAWLSVKAFFRVLAARITGHPPIPQGVLTHER